MIFYPINSVAISSGALQPHMVMTLEIPFYGRGLGGYFEEDILLITEAGHESLTSAPFGLNVIQGAKSNPVNKQSALRG